MFAAPARTYYGDPVLVTPPAALPLSLAELKAHCRIDLADDDALLMGYQRSAVGWVEQHTPLALITQTWRETVSAFPTGTIELRKRPLQAVTSIGVIDPLDESIDTAEIDPSVYVVAGIGGDKRPARINLGASQAWPTVTEAMSIEYRAGFGDTHNDVPELIRHTLLVLVKEYYDNAGAVRDDIRRCVENMLAEWRPFGVA